jgi:electron transfer flavoprotein alpha subunit
MPAVVDATLCNGCGECVDQCPIEAVTLVEGTAQVDVEECSECQACVEPCPESAITCD